MKSPEPLPIVCCTDFSKNAAKAADAAAALAMHFGMPLCLVHVADEFNACGADRRKLAAFVQPAEAQLHVEADRLRATGATVETRLLTGEAAERAIRDFVRQRPAALVVVSSVSKTAFDRWTLGSVSGSLAESVAAPTLVVRESEPFEAWARGERSLKVFVGADFTTSSDAALRWAAELRKFGPCDVLVAQVDRPHEESERLGTDASILDNPPVVQGVLERDLRKRLQTQFGDENVRIVIEPSLERPDSRLVELAVEARADVIVVGTHQRRGLDRLGHPSVSRGILRHAPMSVACVPAAAVAEEGRHVPEIRRVLVATDFSELGDRAVAYAYSLLRDGGTVFLLHVTQPMPTPSPLALDLSAKMDKALEDHTARQHEVSARLHSLIPNEAEERGVASEVAVVEGHAPKGLPHVGMYYGIMGEADVIESADPAEAICQAAERLGADVICLGSHGRSGFSAALMGSVAQAVMAQSHRPVLVVRPPVA